ncbi:glycosyltransferase family 28 C-terminal domain-containing protein [Cantharellus anzutake]|uniref:glycosyltransferase family 28 C-terminal domain-containing protein n=1 Tax=Cantharellus anzutake TaxID=1750568 RepID=UPI001907CA29|nr:glycosyltransferase family 28 C-terminal domain-containing protein [Cantharellus anzutake]KAF8334296.1 glycosyltransferase family 28 C-terminal domain-containing protein [Cantharellus anzutake]
MSVFVTVGSTEHTALVDAVLSEPCLKALSDNGYNKLVIQFGKSVWNRPFSYCSSHDVDISAFDFKASIEDDITASSLVISHAGAGTILDVLRTPKPLIGYLYACSSADLARTIQTKDFSSLKPFPPFDGSHFQRLIDEEMGFI